MKRTLILLLVAGSMFCTVAAARADGTITWTGVTNAQWDNTSANWAVSVSNTASYSDGRAVVFNDKNPMTGANVSNTNITISAPVSPQSITFNNSGAANGGVDYTIGGDAISGSGAARQEWRGNRDTHRREHIHWGHHDHGGSPPDVGCRGPREQHVGALTVTGGTLDLYGDDVSAGPLSGGGAIDSLMNWESSVSAGWGDASSTFSGTIRNTYGTMDLIKTGSGTLTLTGSNSYSGATVINGVPCKSATAAAGRRSAARAG